MNERRIQKQLGRIHGRFFRMCHEIKNSQPVPGRDYLKVLAEINRADEMTVAAFHSLGKIIEEKRQ